MFINDVHLLELYYSQYDFAYLFIQSILPEYQFFHGRTGVTPPQPRNCELNSKVELIREKDLRTVNPCYDCYKFS